MKKIFIASDHGGFKLKKFIKSFLDKDFAIKDLGPKQNKKSVDYPDFAHKLCKQVSKNKNNFGILVCGSGVGMSIAANKIKGIRAANVVDELTAIQSVEHNNVNVLCLGSNNVSNENALSIVLKFLNTYMLEEERYIRRVGKLEN